MAEHFVSLLNRACQAEKRPTKSNLYRFSKWGRAGKRLPNLLA
jgi:hypothetical protein